MKRNYALSYDNFFTTFFFLFFIFSCVLFPCRVQAKGLDSYEDLQAKYKHGEKIRILLVPGHDNEYSGAAFGDVAEAELTLEMAKVLGSYLSQDPKIQVTLARDDDGYNVKFLEYYKSNKEKIMLTVRDKKILMDQMMVSGSLQINEQVGHVDAVDEVVQKLYSLNSWIDVEGFDLVLHIHFNDYGSRYEDTEGEYSGFSIYTPSKELLNATTSKLFSDNIGRNLIKTFYKSNQTDEEEKSNIYGVIEDFYLIAMGAYGTAEAPRALIEYSYVYEKHLNKDIYIITEQTLSRATAAGIHDFLVGKKVSQAKNLEYTWFTTLVSSPLVSADVLALQIGLRELGFLPAKKMTRTDCPFSGVFGACTKKALKAFQAQYGIRQTGEMGPATRKKFNSIFEDR